MFSLKSLTKSVCGAAAAVAVMPAVLICRTQMALTSPERAFPGWSQLFSLIPGLSGEFLRRAFYQRVSAGCGQDACIGFGTVASHPGIAIGRSAYIGPFCCLGQVTIEDDVLIASHVSIMNGCRQHGTERLDVPIRCQPGEFLPVTIGEGAWIGEQAVVAASVGRGSVVGAGALVLNPVPDYAIVAGVPARVIGDRRDRSRSSKRGSDEVPDAVPAGETV